MTPSRFDVTGPIQAYADEVARPGAVPLVERRLEAAAVDEHPSRPVETPDTLAWGADGELGSAVAVEVAERHGVEAEGVVAAMLPQVQVAIAAEGQLREGGRGEQAHESDRLPVHLSVLRVVRDRGEDRMGARITAELRGPCRIPGLARLNSMAC